MTHKVQYGLLFTDCEHIIIMNTCQVLLVYFIVTLYPGCGWFISICLRGHKYNQLSLRGLDSVQYFHMFIKYEPQPEIYSDSLGLLSGRRDMLNFLSQNTGNPFRQAKRKGVRFRLPISQVRDIITANINKCKCFVSIWGEVSMMNRGFMRNRENPWTQWTRTGGPV